MPKRRARATLAGPASAIAETWEKPAPQEIAYTTVNGSCSPAGKAGSDTPTNLLKNRVDVTTSYHEVTFDAIATLSYPNDVTKRIHWQPANLTEIARFEGVPLSVIGYLSHAINVQGKEDTNCGYQHPDKVTEVDWHMYLTKQPSRPISESVVVETTPRVRKDHQWDRTTLLTWVDSTNQVRISGWDNVGLREKLYAVAKLPDLFEALARNVELEAEVAEENSATAHAFLSRVS